MTATLTTVRSVIGRDLDRKIEEIVKVNQDDVETVANEITEYVATDHINREYRDLFGAIAEGPARPTEGVGIWVSGFFGSGKSSFAKNLGYALRNSDVLGTPAGRLLAEQLDDPEITRLIDFITHQVSTTVVMFDVTSERSVRTNNERIAEIVYNILLREFGYPEDWTLAELEITLETEGRLPEFVQRIAARYGNGSGEGPAAVWRAIAKRAGALNRASAVLHEMDPATYPSADTWALAVRGAEPRLDVAQIVSRTFDLMGRRRPGQALAIVIDEVGQYVGRSSEKIEDLRALVEQFGKESANRVKRHQFPAPVWIVVTSQEKLDEVISALDEGRNLLPKLQDRFHHRVDLVPSDIREVATKRVLSKTPEGTEALRQLFAEHGGRLESYTEFERSTRRTDLTQETFAQFYPFLPHFIDLSIDIVTGLRARASNFRQTGAANRTIIKQAHEMLIGEPRLADAPLGTLVTLDKVYDLVRHSAGLDHNHKLELDRIRQEFGDDSWEERVTKALALLELVRNLPRTDKNIAAVLYDRLGAESPLPHVRSALENLSRGQYARDTDEGWKLQTAEEKQWDRERRGLDPRPRERNEAIREAIGKAFADADLRTYKHRGRTFKVGITVQFGASGLETKIGDEGQLTLRIQVAEPGESADDLKVAAQALTRDPKQQHTLIWTFALDQTLDDLAREILRSRAMINKHDNLAAQGKLAPDLKGLLQDEKTGERRLSVRLVEQLTVAIYHGTGFHGGNTYDGSDLGGNLVEAIRGFFERTTPQIFP
jgi:hypothetical protein